MQKFNVKVVNIMVTEWNEEQRDWSGDMFFKNGFNIGVTNSNKLDDVLDTVKTIFDINKYNSEVNEYGRLTFTIIEDEWGFQDDNGCYLVDYIVEVEKIEGIKIEK